MEGLFLLKELLIQNDFMCKIDLKDAYFSVQLAEESQNHVRFQWENQIYQFFAFVLDLPPHQGCSQVTENSHCSSEKTQRESNNIPRRYAIDGQYNRGIVDGQGQTDICVTKFGISFKCSEISPDSPTDFTVFRGKHTLRK